MRSVTIDLAGQTYTINELPSRKNAEWRKQLEGTFNRAEDVINASMRDQSSVADLMGVVHDAKTLILESPDLICALLWAYSPALATDKEQIAENGYESELFDAFVAILRLAFPFGRLIELVRAISVTGSIPNR